MSHVLIIEDESALLNVYAMIFKFQGFKVHTAINGKEALELLKTITPDAIVVDVLMPVMGGIEFLENAKIKDKLPKIKVLVLSNLSDHDTITKVKKLGADEYILKSSVTPAELVTAVDKLLISKH